MSRNCELPIERKSSDLALGRTETGSPRFVFMGKNRSVEVIAGEREEEMERENARARFEDFSESSYGNTDVDKSINFFFAFRIIIQTIYCFGNLIVPIMCINNTELQENFYVRVTVLFYLLSSILSSSGSLYVSYIEIKTRLAEPWRRTKGRILLVCLLIIGCTSSGLTIGLLTAHVKDGYAIICSMSFFIFLNVVIFTWSTKYCIYETQEEFQLLAETS